MTSSASRCLPVLAMALVSLVAAGCSKPPPPQEDAAVVNLRKIVQAFDAAEYKVRRAPKDDAELKKFLVEAGATGDPEQYMRSPRDGQPYVILYGAMLDPEGRNVVLAHEKDGAEGKRYVITLSRDVKLLTPEEFAAAEFAAPAAKKPRKK